MTVVTTLPIEPKLFWGLALILGVIFASLLVMALMPDDKDDRPDPLKAMQTYLGFEGWNGFVFGTLAFLWLGLFLALVAGLFSLLWDVFWRAVPQGEAQKWDYRFTMAQIAALTAVLGAVVTLPITLRRLAYTRIQAETETEALFNDKINAAIQDLHAQRQVTCKDHKNQKRLFNAWEDDVVRRNAGIARLEQLVAEAPIDGGQRKATASRVARLLCVYVREMSEKLKPEETPETESRKELRAWARSLTPRSDMENAVQTLGRLRAIDGIDRDDVKIDLRGANLQGMDLQGAFTEDEKRIAGDFENARLNDAKLQGANLWGATLQGADLRHAKLQGADLGDAQLQGAHLERATLQGANLEHAKLQGAHLRDAKLQGAYLWDAEMDDNTDLAGATLQGAAVGSVDDTTIARLLGFWDDIFADGTVQVPHGPRPAHWAIKSLLFTDFEKEWRRWMREDLGMDPDNPQ